MDIIDWFHALDVAEKVSLSSATIALCALMLALWQGYISREHNILSVRPALAILERYSINDSLNVTVRPIHIPLQSP